MSATATSPRLAVPLALLSVTVVLYSVIVAQELLFGFLVVALVWIFYLLYVIITTLDRIATALERLVDQGEKRNL